MKITKFFMAMAAATVMFAACDKEENKGNGGDFENVAPVLTDDIADIVVTEGTLSNEVTFSYSAADFGVATQINYAVEVQIADGPKAVVATSSTTTAKATLEKINYELYVKLGITVNEPTDVNFYVSAQMGASEKLYSEPVVVNVIAIEAGPMKSEWGLVGTINDWAAPDVPMFIVEPYFVAYNVELTTADEFKIRANEEWNDEKNYGTEVKGTFAPNTIIPVITSGGSQNIGVKEDGLYDVYFDLENSTVYLMTAGKTPDQAGEAVIEYIDGSTLVVGLSGNFAGTEYWVDPADNRLATFKTKELTDETTFSGSYTVEISNCAIASGDALKVRVNGALIGGGEGEATISGLEHTVADDGNIVASESGTYNIIITFDWDGLTQSNVSVTFTK
ncbi:MAG: SusE domain-containing protein [Bacteroidales bacterium]|nr:SusE domain-containing protein [Bacteroidales bacterium]